jgi:hypothetical protein
LVGATDKTVVVMVISGGGSPFYLPSMLPDQKGGKATSSTLQQEEASMAKAAAARAAPKVGDEVIAYVSHRNSKGTVFLSVPGLEGFDVMLPKKELQVGSSMRDAVYASLGRDQSLRGILSTFRGMYRFTSAVLVNE